MNKIEIYSDLIRCGFTLNPQTKKWTKEDLITGKGILPTTRAMYFDYNSEYQYSNVKKLK